MSEWQTQFQAVIRDMIKTGDIAVRQTSAHPCSPEDRVLAISEWVQRLPVILAIGYEAKKAIADGSVQTGATTKIGRAPEGEKSAAL